MSAVRALLASDKGAWRRLFDGYLAFYKTSLSDEQIELTFQRLLHADFNSHALVVEHEGAVRGLAHYSFQTSTWAPNHYCYLEDLFVDPAVRARGLGRALIQSVQDIAVARGSSRLYWNTDASNETARRLYDSFTPVSGKVQYRIQLA